MSKCLLRDELVKKNMICIHTSQKKNEIMSFVATEMEPDIIILSKVSQKEKDMISCIHTI